jgi:magnesium chelatase family protein
LHGVQGQAIEVEVRISAQLPRIDIVGLAETTVRESSARVRAAIASTGLRFPGQRITVNLAPAGLRKCGAGLDLPIAIAILAEAGNLEAESLVHLGLIGELALDGRLRPVRGALALTLAAQQAGCQRMILPTANASEAALAPSIQIYRADSLQEVIHSLLSGEALQHVSPPPPLDFDESIPDLMDVRGQEDAKRALTIAAAGGHALLLQGPPGTGKSMLAKRLPGLVPFLDDEEALEVTRIHSAANQMQDRDLSLIRRRPFRAPHQTTSPAGLFGGGTPPRPGEVSLAHRGVLFLDELPEFQGRVLEQMRQVLEDRQILLSRAQYSCRFPAHFQLIAAANPCPCGWYQSGSRDCRCDDGVIAKYQSRVSGPLLDRIDLRVRVQPLDWSSLDAPPSGLSSEQLRARVQVARQCQSDRLRNLTGRTNAEIPDKLIDDLVDATPEARALLGRAVDRLHLSARGARRTLRTARSIADLNDEQRVGPDAISEALHYRAEIEN